MIRYFFFYQIFTQLFLEYSAHILLVWLLYLLVNRKVSNEQYYYVVEYKWIKELTYLWYRKNKLEKNQIISDQLCFHQLLYLLSVNWWRTVSIFVSLVCYYLFWIWQDVPEMLRKIYGTNGMHFNVKFADYIPLNCNAETKSVLKELCYKIL